MKGSVDSPSTSMAEDLEVLEVLLGHLPMCTCMWTDKWVGQCVYAYIINSSCVGCTYNNNEGMGWREGERERVKG